MNLLNLKQKARQLLVRDQESALELILHSLNVESKIYKEFIHLLGSYSYIEKLLNRGVIQHSIAINNINQIRIATLDCLDKIIEEDLVNNKSKRNITYPEIKTGMVGLRRSILVPNSLIHNEIKSQKFIIALSPLSYQRALGKSKGFSRIYGTYSDFVGVREISQTFGLLFGFEALPEVIDPEDYRDSVLESTPANIYCIASPKTNRWTGLLMRKLNEFWKPAFEFLAEPDSKNLKNVKVALFENGNLKYPEGWNHNTKGDRYKQDYGIIIRGPNPYFPEKMITILSGRSSLGTEAACKAFTAPQIIEQINNRLEFDKINLENHQDAFRVLVSMRRYNNEKYPEADLNTLKIEECKPLLKC